ncbi:MAG TPA: hypothetical protein VKE96_29675 [Vicinamibacterales bacterium]|nr:hypothetical protein [Vicinamibacterales bacterium]
MFKCLTGKSRTAIALGAAVLVVLIVVTALPRSVTGSESSVRMIARGGGTTMIEGGTGSAGGFVPVLTTVAFHAAAAVGGGVTGDFECLARAPRTTTSADSADFTTNAMYVTGHVTDAKRSGDTAALSGMATITGLGAGTDVPFTFVLTKGGPGATAVLTTDGSTRLVFHEVLVEGSFEID